MMAPISEIPVYGWGEWPEHLLTKRQMSEAGFQTGKNLPPPTGKVWRKKSPDGVMYLYDRNQGVPKKPLSDQARANLKAASEKSRASWYCTRCGNPTGWVDRKGHFHAKACNPPGLCAYCQDRADSENWARELLAGEFVILDTETTGLHAGRDEIVQIAVINQTGETLLDTYVHAQYPMRLFARDGNGQSASDVNGITPEMLLDAPGWPEVYARLQEVVAGRKVVIYNSEFDLGMIEGDCKRHGIQAQELDTDCAMHAYASYVGDWSSYLGNYRWQPLPGGGHTALSDCLACLDVIRVMAKEEKEELS